MSAAQAIDYSGMADEVAAAVRDAVELGWRVSQTHGRTLLASPVGEQTVALGDCRQFRGTKLKGLQQKIIRYAEPGVAERLAAKRDRERQAEQRRVAAAQAREVAAATARAEAAQAAADPIAQEAVVTDLLAARERRGGEPVAVVASKPTDSQILERVRELVLDGLAEREAELAGRIETLTADYEERILDLETSLETVTRERDGLLADLAEVQRVFSRLGGGS